MFKEAAFTADFSGAIQSIYALEQLSGKSTCIHRLHPIAKLVSTFFFIAAVVSFGRYTFSRLIPYVFYPTIILALSETPYSLLLRRTALALPFCLLAGVSALALDTGTAFMIGRIPVSFGFLSFCSLLLKTYLCVMAVLLLVATTPIYKLTEALRALRVPMLFISVFEMTYRYIGTLLSEAGSMYLAYQLRGGRKRGVDIRHMGSFLGQLLLRSFDRSERVYEAMKCRGYPPSAAQNERTRLSRSDYIYGILISAAAVVLRVFDIPSYFNSFIGRLLT